jgi:hypothetical protein
MTVLVGPQSHRSTGRSKAVHSNASAQAAFLLRSRHRSSPQRASRRQWLGFHATAGIPAPANRRCGQLERFLLFHPSGRHYCFRKQAYIKRCRVLVLAASLLGAPMGRGTETQGLPLLTSVRQVRELCPERADRGYPVRLRGVLTFNDWYVSFVQDAGGGIYVRNFDLTEPAGTEVEGFSAQGRSLQIIVGQERRPCKWFKTKLKDPANSTNELFDLRFGR